MQRGVQPLKAITKLLTKLLTKIKIIMKYYIVSKVEELKGITLNDARVMTPEEAAKIDWIVSAQGMLKLLSVDSLCTAIKGLLKDSASLLYAKALLKAASDLQQDLSCTLFSSSDVVKATEAANDLNELHTAVLVLRNAIVEYTNANFSWYKEEWEKATMQEILNSIIGYEE